MDWLVCLTSSSMLCQADLDDCLYRSAAIVLRVRFLIDGMHSDIHAYVRVFIFMPVLKGICFRVPTTHCILNLVDWIVCAEFMEKRLGFQPNEIPEKRSQFYTDHGTTLAGLVVSIAIADCLGAE